VSPYCPLCKAKVDTIVHTVVSDKQYQVFELIPTKRKPIPIRPARTWGRISESDRKWIQELERRRQIYISKKRAKLRGTTTTSKIPDPSPSYFKKYPEKMKVLTGWIRRDLNAIIPNLPVEIVREYVQTLLQTHHIQSEIAFELLSEYLGSNTELFIHELVCFAKSSFSMEDYDKYVQYQ
jgi:E3 ubiquitin-protein ligase Topors